MPGFYQNLYAMIAEPVLQRPYSNSGIFVTPIDFQKIPTSFMNNKLRFKIPVTRLDPDYCVLTYVLNDERIALPLTLENLEKTANLWPADLVQTWFAKDQSKIFFYVPQIAVYQPQGIPVHREDVDEFMR